METTFETEYLQLLNHLINHGTLRQTRNAQTLSDFGHKLKFDLRTGFPLLTTKKMAWRAIVEELLWFLRGETDEKILSSKGVKIWSANAQTRQVSDGCGSSDLGPIYGFQWRHFGAVYQDCHTDYTGQGVDQWLNCLEQIRDDPTSRRIFMSAWNPVDLKSMALPPCHVSCQFYVEDQYLDLQMYQRSADVGLGLPFNIASYALLLSITAHMTKLQPRYLHMALGDVHIYQDHIEALKTQAKRQPYNPPTLTITAEPDRPIESYLFEDFTLNDYQHHSAIKMAMTV